MRAFFDESAISPKDGRFMIMAGFVGSVEEFEKASDAWQECLDESPSVPLFHHKTRNCMSKIGPLANIIRNHDLQGFVITVPHAPFVDRDPRLTKGLIGSRIYDWAFVNTVKYVLHWVSRNFPEGEKVDFIFEKRRELAPCIELLYNPLSIEGAGVWNRAGSCTAEEDKRVAALQMADLLAGQSLESMRMGRKSQVIDTLEKERSIFIINEKPHEVIEQALFLQSVGKKIYDAGMRKIMGAPRDAIDPALFMQEYRALQEINRLVQKNNDLLEKEGNSLNEKPDE